MKCFDLVKQREKDSVMTQIGAQNDSKRLLFSFHVEKGDIFSKIYSVT